MNESERQPVFGLNFGLASMANIVFRPNFSTNSRETYEGKFVHRIFEFKTI